MNEIEIIDDAINIPVIPLRGLVVFPQMTLHFDVGRKKSVSSLKNAMKTNQKVFLVAQKDATIDEPKIDDLFNIGVVCIVKQMMKIPNSDNLRVVVEGTERAQLISFNQIKPFIEATVKPLQDKIKPFNPDSELAYRRAVKREFEIYASYVPKISNDVITQVIAMDDSSKLADYICSNTFLDYRDKQSVLEILVPTDKLMETLVLIKKENSTLEIETRIQERVQDEIDKNQREYYLREEMKIIAETLGEDDNPIEEGEEYRNKVKALKCSDEIKTILFKECDKLTKMPQGSHEGAVIRTYLDKCLEIPFGKYTKDSINLEKARKILDKDHFGLEKVKDRVIESLAVLKRNPDFSGQILCLVGPPGVGKTSIVKSLAKGMNRKYERIALGGVHDEAEIRGHRKTYIGSMPGRIIDAVIKSKTLNPIILLDEIDKLGNDYKGDPSSALLEALDPEQNNTFTDHYIDFPIDLSKVLFITTANDVSTISAPLYDRMEVIELNSYTQVEKFNIAKKHLVKKELKKHSLSSKEVKISNDAINDIIEYYTREAGVRNLEKTISSIMRKATVAIESGEKLFNVSCDNIEDVLGAKKYIDSNIPKENLVGTVNGLAWTSVGGTMLPIEVSAFDGTGKIEITGNLGDIMTESVKTAVGYVRSMAKNFGIDKEFYKTKDIHIHAPEAAIPKDGPSAGLAITTAIVSELTGIPIKCSVAMTGEISLKGKALAIGGLKEKSMAAYKSGCKTVIIPNENERDLKEISNEVKENVDFISVSTFLDVIPIALEHSPKSISFEKQKENTVMIDKKENQRAVVTQ